MGKFGTVYFTSENKILQNDKYFKIKQKCAIKFEMISKWDIKGYNIFIPFMHEDLNRLPEPTKSRIWHHIEQELLKKDIEYVVFRAGFVENNFKTIQVTTGESIRCLFADKLYRYIKRQKWINKASQYVQVGIIAGDVATTEAVAMLLATEVHYLYIFTPDTARFKKLVEYIYQETGLRVEQQYPVAFNFSKPDIIFNLREDNLYLRDIQQDKIYIDLLSSYDLNKVVLNPQLPRIGYDFYVKYGQEGASIPLLEAVLCSDGLSPRLIKKKVLTNSFIVGKIYMTTAEVDNACYSAL